MYKNDALKLVLVLQQHTPIQLCPYLFFPPIAI